MALPKALPVRPYTNPKVRPTPNGMRAQNHFLSKSCNRRPAITSQKGIDIALTIRAGVCRPASTMLLTTSSTTASQYRLRFERPLMKVRMRFDCTSLKPLLPAV